MLLKKPLLLLVVLLVVIEYNTENSIYEKQTNKSLYKCITFEVFLISITKMVITVLISYKKSN